MQCGIASLAMVCRYYGKNYSTNFLSKICTSTSEGVSMLAISEAATYIGLRTVIAYVSVSELLEQDTSLPCILYWNQNHFVVLYKNKKGKKFYIADPGKGLVDYHLEDFCHHWVSTHSNGEKKGVAMFLEPTENFGRVALDEDNIENHSFLFLFGYVRQYRKYFTQIFVGLLLGCILQLIMPYLTQSIVDIGIANKDISFIWLVLFGELFIVVGRTAIGFIRRWLLLHISMRINLSLVSDFFIKLLLLPMSFFDTKQMGDLLQRIGDHSRVQSFLTSQVLNIIFTFLSFMIFGIVLLVYNKLVFSLFVVGSIIYGLWILLFLQRRKVLDYEIFEQQAISQNCTYQFITTIQEIKLQDCEQRRRWEWEDAQVALFQVQMKSLKLQQFQEAGSIFINEVKNILITVFAATSVVEGQITLGTMLAIQYIVGQLNSPIEQFMSFVYSLQDVKLSLERIHEIHERKNEESKINQLNSFDDDKSISIKQISYKYDPYSPNRIIDNVSFDIPEGKVTAIVGASGSGKTTLIKLLLGYYPVASGEISISGKNINDYNLKWWRRHCGVVMQDGVIFSESIARNIAVDDGEVDVLRLEKAAKIANIHDYILSLPLKYDTKIGRDGAGLSQGQKQRILIARAVYKNPDFIFLDEATNSLDAQNERNIVENLNEFYKGRTVVVVAHRLSTIKNADQIIVLNRGRIVETGNHQRLVLKRGMYYNLVKNQLELGC